jgi:hypothetical protein
VDSVANDLFTRLISFKQAPFGTRFLLFTYSKKAGAEAPVQVLQEDAVAAYRI